MTLVIHPSPLAKPDTHVEEMRDKCLAIVEDAEKELHNYLEEQQVSVMMGDEFGPRISSLFTDIYRRILAAKGPHLSFDMCLSVLSDIDLYEDAIQQLLDLIPEEHLRQRLTREGDIVIHTRTIDERSMVDEFIRGRLYPRVNDQQALVSIF